jgi:hypothetical protein
MLSIPTKTMHITFDIGSTNDQSFVSKHKSQMDRGQQNQSIDQNNNVVNHSSKPHIHGISYCLDKNMKKSSIRLL